MKIPQDYHIHSRFSEDAQDSLESLCIEAVKLGIPEIGFSEHWDVGPHEQNPHYFKPEPWFTELHRLQEHFKGTLTIRAGLEVAEPHLYSNQYFHLIEDFCFDYIIGSVHWVGPHFMFDEQYLQRSSPDQVYGSYFHELENMVTTSEIDIVAHFDIPARAGKAFIGYDPHSFENKIKKVLRIMIGRNLVLEINTAGYRKTLKNLMPDPIILKWYFELGGRKISLGSDAHQADQVGAYIEQAIPILLSLGFTNLISLEKRQSKQIPILQDKE